MKKTYLFLIFLNFLIFNQIKISSNQIHNEKKTEWEIVDDKFNSNDWIEIDEIEKKDKEELLLLRKKKDKKYLISSSNNVKGYGNSVVYNGKLYPDISSYVPHAYVEDYGKKLSIHFRGISRTRFSKPGKIGSGSDGVLDTDFNIFANENNSFLFRWSLQSLSSRNEGTKFFEGNSFGFKYAKKISEKWSVALGGNNIFHLDDTIDLGRNFYLVGSTYRPSKLNKNRALFINLGIGSDFYGYKGNGYIAKTYCFSGRTLTGEGQALCSWGPIASVSYAFNDRFSVLSEWFGYGFGSGISLRPFKEFPLTSTLMVTDFLGNFPNYISEGSGACYNYKCSPRIYGTLSIFF